MFTMLKAIFNELASINAMLGSIVSFIDKARTLATLVV